MNIFLSLALILVAAKLLGMLAKRLQVPSVVGELFAGILIGPSILAWIHPSEILSILAEIGVILLLFEVGLDSHFDILKKVGRPAMMVAIVGFVLPFLFAFPLSHFAFDRPIMPSLFMAGALTATSIGITVRVLVDLKQRHRREANIVIAAAIFDDILGVALLGILLSLASTSMGSFSSLFETGFILIAFSLGLILSRRESFKEKRTKHLRSLIEVITPIFFVMVGASINLQSITWNSPAIWILFVSLLLVAFLGKFASGFAIMKEPRSIQTIVGLSMLPRGEVGLIFAQLGLQSGVLNQEEYTVLILVVVATTFMAPFLLRWRYLKNKNME